MGRVLSAIAAAIGSWGVWCAELTAHPIYVAQTRETITDHLTTNPVVVLAGPTEESPYKFHPKTWLKGSAELGLPPIPFHVDSDTRRQLATHPNQSVLFVFGAGESARWQRVAYVTPPMREVVDAIISEQSGWAADRNDPLRFAFFAERHNDKNLTIRSLAMTEILQSRYGLMRTLEPQLSQSEIEDALSDPMLVNYAPLYIAMLGLIEDAGAAALVRSMVVRGQRLNLGPRLAPWAVALIETEGALGVRRVAQIALGVVPSNFETRLAALNALALHGAEGRTELRADIASILNLIAERDADLAVYAISPLAQWQDWRAQDVVRAYLQGTHPISMQERIAFTGYLAAAERAASVSD